MGPFPPPSKQSVSTKPKDSEIRIFLIDNIIPKKIHNEEVPLYLSIEAKIITTLRGLYCDINSPLP